MKNISLKKFEQLDERTWGTIRLFATLLLLWMWIGLGYILFRVSGFPGLGLRYLFTPLIIFAFILLLGARYVNDFYSLKTLNTAFQYLNSLLYSIGFPTLVVAEGRKMLKTGEINLIDVLGGPGYVTITPGNVVLFETLQGTTHVRGSGRHFISKFETIKEIVSVEEHYGEVDRVSATTKDGIEIVVSNIRFRYRLLEGTSGPVGPAQTLNNPYPFDEQAVRALTYNRWVTSEGIADWHAGIKSAVQGAIIQYITQHSLDHLTAPRLNNSDPRGEINRNLNSDMIRSRLRELGAKLNWFDIGHFEIPEKEVAEQRLNTWRSGWAGNANAVRSFSQVQLQAYQNMGRAEGQAEMLVAIVHNLENIGVDTSDPEDLHKVFLSRTAKILQSMNDQRPKQTSGR